MKYLYYSYPCIFLLLHHSASAFRNTTRLLQHKPLLIHEIRPFKSASQCICIKFPPRWGIVPKFIVLYTTKPVQIPPKPRYANIQQMLFHRNTKHRRIVIYTGRNKLTVSYAPCVYAVNSRLCFFFFGLKGGKTINVFAQVPKHESREIS